MDAPCVTLFKPSSGSDIKDHMMNPKKYGVIWNSSGDTNWSLVDPGADFSPPPTQNDKETRVDALSAEQQLTRDLRRTDLKQEKTS